MIVSEGGQCGGLRYIGPTQCAANLTCYILTDYFSQCIRMTNSECTLFPSRTTSINKDWRNENGFNYISPVKSQSACNSWYI